MSGLRSRGLTLVEMLLALVLLGAVTAAAASWTALAARTSVQHAAPNAWSSAAEATLRLIHDDIACGDLAPDDKDDRHPAPHVTLVDGVLTIRTRSAEDKGAAVHAYRHDREAHRLSLASQSAARPDPCLLLDEVESFECTLDLENGSLVVKIVRSPSSNEPAAGSSTSPLTIRRRFILP